jgi:hypothetical protein
MTSAPQGTAINWFRVTVEGAVIVVSILLAFGIDAAWDRHVERREEAEILADLSVEVSQNLQTLTRLTALHQRVIDDAGRLVAMSSSELLAMPTAEVRPFFFVLISRVSFTPVDGTLESALSSGRLNRIQNDSVRNGLVEWRGLAEDTGEEVVELRQATRDILAHTRGKGLMGVGSQFVDRGIDDVLLFEGREPGEVLADLVSDPAFIDLVIWKADSHWEYLNELKDLRDLLQRIQNQMGG